MTGPTLTAQALAALEARHRCNLAALAAQGSPAAQEALAQGLRAARQGGR